jgi:shikimate kinase
MLDRNIYLTGFMGSGKSLKGRALAQLLRRQFVDMDDELERAFGKPIADVFAQDGEQAFRKAETALLKRLARRSRLVVATGGGVPAQPENGPVMRKSGAVVHLSVPLDVIRGRLTDDDIRRRPLWADEDAVRQLFDARKDAYAQCDAAVDGTLEPFPAACRILSRIYSHAPLTAWPGHIWTDTAPSSPTRSTSWFRRAKNRRRCAARAVCTSACWTISSAATMFSWLLAEA